MTQKQINKWIKEAHDNAVGKGFYECPECEGKGTFYQKNPDCLASCGLDNPEICESYEDCEEGYGGFYCGIATICDSCNGTGIDPNKNMGELLMLIVCEIAEAVEAHRCGKLFSKLTFDKDLFLDDVIFGLSQNETISISKKGFEIYCKDTFEDELADVFIRLFDLCGYLGHELNLNCDSTVLKEKGNVGEDLYCSLLKLPSLNSSFKNGVFDWFFVFILSFCQHHNIPIEKHITAKMAYNKTRPRKHGKEY